MKAAIVLIGLVAVLGLAACGGASSPSSPALPATPLATSSAPAPAGLVTPGHSTPQEAVDGFYRSELAGNWTAVCSYVTPSAQPLCVAATSGQPAATGSAFVRGAVTQGSKALVEVTGKVCNSGDSPPCASNTDPNTGMPPSLPGFPASYAAAVASSASGATVLSPLPCSKVNGRWYVVFG